MFINVSSIDIDTMNLSFVSTSFAFLLTTTLRNILSVQLGTRWWKHPRRKNEKKHQRTRKWNRASVWHFLFYLLWFSLSCCVFSVSHQNKNCCVRFLISIRWWCTSYTHRKKRSYHHIDVHWKCLCTNMYLVLVRGIAFSNTYKHGVTYTLYTST